MKNSIDLFDDMMQEAEDIKQRKQMGEQLLKDIPDLYDKLKLRDATYSDGVIHVEPIKVDNSPDAEGMKPELFGVLLDGLQEVVDIESGKIDESEYDVVEIQAEENEDAIGSHNYTN